MEVTADTIIRTVGILIVIANIVAITIQIAAIPMPISMVATTIQTADIRMPISMAAIIIPALVIRMPISMVATIIRTMDTPSRINGFCPGVVPVIISSYFAGITPKPHKMLYQNTFLYFYNIIKLNWRRKWQI